MSSWILTERDLEVSAGEDLVPRHDVQRAPLQCCLAAGRAARTARVLDTASDAAPMQRTRKRKRGAADGAGATGHDAADAGASRPAPALHPAVSAASTRATHDPVPADRFTPTMHPLQEACEDPGEVSGPVLLVTGGMSPSAARALLAPCGADTGVHGMQPWSGSGALDDAPAIFAPALTCPGSAGAGLAPGPAHDDLLEPFDESSVGSARHTGAGSDSQASAPGSCASKGVVHGSRREAAGETACSTDFAHAATARTFMRSDFDREVEIAVLQRRVLDLQAHNEMLVGTVVAAVVNHENEREENEALRADNQRYQKALDDLILRHNETLKQNYRLQSSLARTREPAPTAP